MLVGDRRALAGSIGLSLRKSPLPTLRREASLLRGLHETARATSPQNQTIPCAPLNSRWVHTRAVANGRQGAVSGVKAVKGVGRRPSHAGTRTAILAPWLGLTAAPIGIQNISGLRQGLPCPPTPR
jgi:hypothetical protein